MISQNDRPLSRRELREQRRAVEDGQAVVGETAQEQPSETAREAAPWPFQFPPTSAAPAPATPAAVEPPIEEHQAPPQPSSRADARADRAEPPAYRIRDFTSDGRGAAFATTAEPRIQHPRDAGASTFSSRRDRRAAEAAASISTPTVPAHAAPVPLVEPVLNEPLPSGPVLNGPVQSEPMSSDPVRHEPALHEPALHEPAPAANPAAPTSAAATESPFHFDPPADRTYSRRELRALREAAMAEQGITPVTDEPESAAAAAPAAPPIPTMPVAPPVPVAPEIIDLTAERPHRTPQPAGTDPASPATPEGGEQHRDWAVAPEVTPPPQGHWSTHSSINDDYRGAPARDLSHTGAITTSALVLPTVPTGPVTGPITGSGEILLTGSINLPRNLGVAGLHPSRFDQSDVDALLEATDREDAAPDSAPVRAMRAVSTHTSTQSVLVGRKPKRGGFPFVALAVAAGVMLVGVVVLVVAGWVMQIF